MIPDRTAPLGKHAHWRRSPLSTQLTSRSPSVLPHTLIYYIITCPSPSRLSFLLPIPTVERSLSFLSPISPLVHFFHSFKKCSSGLSLFLFTHGSSRIPPGPLNIPPPQIAPVSSIAVDLLVSLERPSLFGLARNSLFWI